MKTIGQMALMIALFCGSLFAGEGRVGEVVKVFTGKYNKPTVEAKVGDMLVFSVGGGTYPGGMVQNLKVEVKGDSLTQIGVFSVPQINEEGQRAVGGIDMSAFLKASKVGEVTITITPLGDLNDALSKPRKFLVIVTKPDETE